MGLLNHPDVMRAVKPDQTPVAGACRFVFKAGSDNLCPIFRLTHSRLRSNTCSQTNSKACRRSRH